MTTPTTTERADSPLTRDLIHALRYYLGNRRALLVLAIIAIVAGLAFNWSWLVAVGLAPILLSTLPCLVMCAVGVCVMCRSGDRQSAAVRDVSDVATPSATLAVSATDDPPASVASCCQGQLSEAKPTDD